MTTEANMTDINFDEAGDSLPEPMLMVLRDTAHAYHKLGDIGRPESDRVEFIQIWSEKPGFFVGRFTEGFGFIGVHFPRAACSALTGKEEKWLADKRTGIGPFPGTGAPKKGSL